MEENMRTTGKNLWKISI